MSYILIFAIISVCKTNIFLAILYFYFAIFIFVFYSILKFSFAMFNFYFAKLYFLLLFLCVALNRLHTPGVFKGSNRSEERTRRNSDTMTLRSVQSRCYKIRYV